MKLPEEFTTYTQQCLGDDLAQALFSGLSEAPTVSLRVNPFKWRQLLPDTPFSASLLVDNAAEAVPWCQGGYYLTERPNFTFDPLLHGGLYYVQEASSMFLDTVIRQLVKQPVHMLDLCAAPGGKTTCAMAALPEGSTLHCNEPMRQRAQILNENILKFGHPDVTVTNAYPKDYRKAGLLFDVILTDVPCSGEGMFRKDAGAIDEWSTANVAKCQKLQREIVETIWPCLRPGGLLIYSTCTFNAHENEENVAWIAKELGADFVEISTQPEWNITGAVTGRNPVYRFLPGRTRGEGLFMAVLRKKADSLSPALSTMGNGANSLTEKKKGALERFTLSHGPLADTVKGKNAIPDVSKALSLNAGQYDFPTAEISWATAISYLQGQSIVLPADAPRGFVAVTFKGLPIGLVKNLGNRANNLHPQPWRIRTTHIPTEETKIIKI